MHPDAHALLAGLLTQLKENGSLTQPAVAAAFRAVPRHLFLPDLPLSEVYLDDAIPTKMGDGYPISSSSQPSMMAIMLEQLDLAPGQTVLEIGAGTGYNAALMGYLVGPAGRVITVDIDEDLVQAAREHLAAASAGNVTAVCADGGLGYPPAAPYDRIVLTVGAWDLTPAWIDQLKPGGRLLLPLAFGAGAQKAIAFMKPVDPQPGQALLTSLSIRDCGFMRLRGAFSGPERVLPLGPEPGLVLMTAAEPPAPPETLYGWLRGSYQDARTGLRLEPQAVWQGLSFWLDVSEPNGCGLSVTGEAARHSPVPSLLEYEGGRSASLNFGVLGPQGLSLAYLAGSRPELWVRTFGPPGREALEARLIAHLASWDAAGRPSSAGMRVRVFPAAAPHPAAPGGIVVQKQWTSLVIDWPPRPAP